MPTANRPRRKSSATHTTYRRRTPTIRSLLMQLFRAILRALKKQNRAK